MAKKKIEPMPSSTPEQDEKFLAILAGCNVSFYKEPPKDPTRYSRWERSEWVLKPGKEPLDLDKHYLYVQWCSGGVSGGSCWDTGENGDPHYAMSGEAEPEFDAIDTVLTVVCPNLSFLQYKKLLAGNLVTRDEYSQDEYYGNCTNYTFKRIKLRDLLNKLVEMELFQ